MATAMASQGDESAWDSAVSLGDRELALPGRELAGVIGVPKAANWRFRRSAPGAVAYRWDRCRPAATNAPGSGLAQVAQRSLYAPRHGSDSGDHVIGVIGAADSVQLVGQVAEELGLAGRVIGQAYTTPDQAPALARQLDPLCGVILFTGRVPYVLSLASGRFQSRVDYIPHEGADLYRSLAGLLLTDKHRGLLPHISLDTIAPEIAQEAFLDLGVEPPTHVLPLDIVHHDLMFATADIVRFHVERYEQDHVEVCLTCVGAVHQALEERGVPSVRVAHTRTAVREALARGRLSLELHRAEASQLAVCLLELPSSEGSGAARSSRRNVAEEVARRYADTLGGTIASLDDGQLVIHTTRGLVEREMGSEFSAPSSLLATEFRDLVHVGFGLGATAAAAQRNAREALGFARREHVPYLCLEDGVVIPVGDGEPSTVRETDPARLKVAEDLGFSPALLRRLAAAFRQLDPEGFTAQDLASVHGVRTRSARRIISRLEEAGLAEQCGTQKGPGAGRPQTVYRVKIDRLLPSGSVSGA